MRGYTILINDYGNLPEKESELYKDLTQLSRAERRVLNQPLQDSNKDAVVLYHEENSIIGTSLEKGSCLGIVTSVVRGIPI